MSNEFTYVLVNMDIVLGVDTEEWNNSSDEQKSQILKNTLDRIVSEADGLSPDKMIVRARMTEEEYMSYLDDLGGR